jgi:metal-responsive CopG/Arc/MetJ family transcriptional regulator
VLTVQVNLEESLVKEVDRARRRLAISRSAFVRDALRAALDRLRDGALEEKHRAGYERKPVSASEIADWEEEQIWPD